MIPVIHPQWTITYQLPPRLAKPMTRQSEYQDTATRQAPKPNQLVTDHAKMQSKSTLPKLRLLRQTNT